MDQPPAEIQSSRLTVYPLLALAAVIALVFAPVCTNDFVQWDDPQTLISNPDLNPPTWGTVVRYWDVRRPYMDLYVPLTYTVWAGVAQVAYVPPPEGPLLNPSIFHAASLGLHLLSACAACLLLYRLTRSKLAAWLGALLFAVHPVQVESVAWASGLKDVLAGMLALVALWQYVEFARATSVSPLAGSTGGPPVPPTLHGRAARATLNYALATLAFILAMLAKPSAVIAPLLAAIIDLLILRRPLRRMLLPVGFWLILAIPCIIIGRHAQPAASLPFIPPLWARPIIALDALAFYLKQLVLPLHLGIDYGRSPQWLWHSRQIWFTWIVPVTVLAAAIVWDRAGGRVGQDLPSPGTPGEGRVRVQSQQASSSTRSAGSEPSPGLRPTSRGGGVPGEVKAGPTVLASCLLFGAALLPTLGLVPFDFQIFSTVTDHYLYLPMLAPALLLAAILARRRGVFPIVVTAVMLSLLGAQSIRQTFHWRDSDALFAHTLEVNSSSPVINVNVGKLWCERGFAARRMGNSALARFCYQKSIPHYEQALRTTRQLGDRRGQCLALGNLGTSLSALGRLPEAIACFRQALEIDPDDYVARSGLEEALRQNAQSPTTTPTKN